jgi:hypothetical protein
MASSLWYSASARRATLARVCFTRGGFTGEIL